ncbi:hypothetical protein CYMTET_40838 [Cymbomonas tetramitiformis]|uniref:Uncharacterized protein n=1 Tax=Cymbomonas tetramitiformis TaxID=36881 RepID=A0AAE0C7A7_9CHLO|nr:hypothetical protein CYMTET_40838 [Cymbomonas tetramitiformis]
MIPGRNGDALGEKLGFARPGRGNRPNGAEGGGPEVGAGVWVGTGADCAEIDCPMLDDRTFAAEGSHIARSISSRSTMRIQVGGGIAAAVHHDGLH